MAGTIVNNPVVQFFDNNGNPLAGGKITTYLSNTTTPASTWQNEGLSVLNTNPIVLNSRGEATIWLTPDVQYTFVLTDANDNLIQTVNDIYGGFQSVNGIDASLISYTPAGTGAVATTAALVFGNAIYSNQYSTLQQAVDAAVGKTLYVIGSISISDEVLLDSNTAIVLLPGSVITQTDTSSSILKAVSKTNVSVIGWGGELAYSGSGPTGLIGGVDYNSCSNCNVENVIFDGMQFSGVFLNSSSNCTVSGNRVSNTLGTHPDANDICVYNTANFNNIFENYCYGDGAHGILVQGTGTAVPLRNSLKNNVIDQKTTYGIACYQVTAGNSYTEIVGNKIRDILGSGLGGASGPGIYVQTSGGCIVTGNDVANCCTLTSSTTNLPAGISVASSSYAIAACQVSGNRVNQPKWYGIAVSGQAAEVSDNYVFFNDGLDGYGIHVLNPRNVSVIGNTVETGTTVARQLISVLASSAGSYGVSVQGNKTSGGDSLIIDIAAGGSSLNDVTVSGNTVKNVGAASIGLALRSVSRGSVVGNTVEGNNSGLYIESCTDVRGSCNISRSTSRTFLSVGSNARVFFDQTNEFGIETSNALIQNTGSGCNLEQRSNASPGSGNWQVGDRIVKSVPVVGQPKAWVNTVAGAPGTFVSEGNL